MRDEGDILGADLAVAFFVMASSQGQQPAQVQLDVEELADLHALLGTALIETAKVNVARGRDLRRLVDNADGYDGHYFLWLIKL